MQNYFIADAHLGHKNIAAFRDRVVSMHHNTEVIASAWDRTVTSKKDIVHCLGDMAFDPAHNKIIQELPGRKILYSGNHDDEISYEEQQETYEYIYGIRGWKRKAWISHAPLHPMELRGKPNVHGHTHSLEMGEGYYNVCVENLLETFGTPIISLPQLRDWIAASTNTI